MCGTCGKEYDVPIHCNQQMVMDHVGPDLKCPVCQDTKKLPQCCNGPLEFWE